MLLVFVFTFQTQTYETYTLSSTVNLIVQRPDFLGSSTRLGILGIYIFIFMLVISYVAIRTRKIKYSNFKDTKKVNVFILLLFSSSIFTAALYIILFKTPYVLVGNIVLISGFLLVSTLCQLLLFSTKVVPVVIEKCLHNKGHAKVPVA